MISILHHDAASVSAEPEEYLTHWQIITVSTGERYFCGLRGNGETIRISTPIVEYNPIMQTGRTQSGRVYRLIGPSLERIHDDG